MVPTKNEEKQLHGKGNKWEHLERYHCRQNQTETSFLLFFESYNVDTKKGGHWNNGLNQLKWGRPAMQFLDYIKHRIHLDKPVGRVRRPGKSSKEDVSSWASLLTGHNNRKKKVLTFLRLLDAQKRCFIEKMRSFKTDDLGRWNIQLFSSHWILPVNLQNWPLYKISKREIDQFRFILWKVSNFSCISAKLCNFHLDTWNKRQKNEKTH